MRNRRPVCTVGAPGGTLSVCGSCKRVVAVGRSGQVSGRQELVVDAEGFVRGLRVVIQRL